MTPIAQILSAKARDKRDSLKAKADHQYVVYQTLKSKGDILGAEKAFRKHTELLRQSRYAAYRMSKHTM